MSGGSYRDPVKVVVINTEYIETDARSFKSVVQRLTGKDSTVGAADEPLSLDGERKLRNGGGMAEMSPTLSRGMSFKDFDKLFKDLPPLEELYRAIN